MDNPSSKKPFAIRGIMFDPARLTERHEFYIDVLPQLAAWGYNTIWWHFCDDEGFALKLKSHPELATPYALTRSETRRFVHAAGELGIDVVPEVESLGHGLAVTRLPQYRHLLDGKPWGHNAICPSHPDTIPLVEEIIDEVADIFEGPYLHAGLDEADLSGCARCEERSAGKPAWWIFEQHALAVREMIVGRGKLMIMWADAIEKNPQLLDVLPRDIVLAHWHYREIPQGVIEPSIRAGFDIVCVPAVSGDMAQPNETNLRNVSDMTAIARDLTKAPDSGPTAEVSPEDARSSPAADRKQHGPQCRGMVVCWWEPFRILRDTYPLAVAFTGRAMVDGRAPDPASFTEAFVREYFGIDGGVGASVGCALTVLHRHAPEFTELRMLLPAGAADIHGALSFAQSADLESVHHDLREALAVLEEAAAAVRKHEAEYRAYVLSGRIFEGAYRNGMDIAAAHESYTTATDLHQTNHPRDDVRPHLRAAATQMSGAAKRTKSLARDVGNEWDRTRYPGDTKKDNSSAYMRQRGRRAIAARVEASRKFLEKLSDRAAEGAQQYEAGEGFPLGV